MKIMKKSVALAVAVITAVLFIASPARAEALRIGWGFLFPIPLPIPIYQVPHEPSPVTIGLLFPIPIPLPVYDYGYYRRPVPVIIEERQPVERRPVEVQPEERYGMLKTLVRPASAEVFIDGKYYGKAGEFEKRKDAATLNPGNRKVEFRAPGYKTYLIEVEVLPGKLVTVEYEMQPVQ
jgi:hypothetical protein